jgi:hypothetical protein
MIPVKPIAAEANRPNQLKIKWGLEGKRLTAFSKLSPHRIANTKRAERMKSARVAKQNVQQHGFDRKLMPALSYCYCRVPVHYINFTIPPIHVSIVYIVFPFGSQMFT